MRVVVTGATSMIGVALIDICIKKNCDVLAIVRKGTKRLERLPKSDLIRIEYADLDSLSSVQGDGETYDVFYHFAWGHTIKAERDCPVLQEDNVRNTLKAVELANKLGCKKFIGAGSQAEYGQVNGMTHIWGRIFSVYGCNDNEGTMLNYAINQFFKGEIAEFSSATQIWNYLNEEDAGKMFYLMGKKDIESGIYCVANTESKILKEYIEELRTVMGGETKCNFAPIETESKSIGLCVDMKKTIDAIDFFPQISFKDGVEKLIKNK